MDQLKNLASSMGGNQQQQQQQQPAVGAQQEDYLDKGLDAVEKKFGMNAQQNRNMNEKVTDGAREMFEKATGKHVPAKFSN